MQVIQMIKRLNNTELGKGGTHETYVLVPKKLDVSDMFKNPGEEIFYIDKKSGEKFKFRYMVYSNGEKRIVGLGRLYSEYKMSAGDEIMFEVRINADKYLYYVDTYKKDNVIIFQKSTKFGFEMLNSERKNLINGIEIIEYNSKEKNIKIEFLQSQKKRVDSAQLTDFYDIKIDDISISNEYKDKELLEIEINNNIARLKKFCSWKKYKFEVGDYCE